MDSAYSDEELMLSYGRGNAEAFEVLYERHKGPLYRYLLRQCGNAATADELFQDVWMNLIRTRASYTVRARFTTYLFRIAHNRLIDHYRRQSRGIPVSFSGADCPDEISLPAGEQTQPDQRVEGERRIEKLLGLIDALPEAQREAWLLREHSGLSLEQIAEVTGVGVETAKSRLRYAVTRLRRGMGEES